MRTLGGSQLHSGAVFQARTLVRAACPDSWEFISCLLVRSVRDAGGPESFCSHPSPSGWAPRTDLLPSLANSLPHPPLPTWGEGGCCDVRGPRGRDAVRPHGARPRGSRSTLTVRAPEGGARCSVWFPRGRAALVPVAPRLGASGPRVTQQQATDTTHGENPGTSQSTVRYGFPCRLYPNCQGVACEHPALETRPARH